MFFFITALTIFLVTLFKIFLFYNTQNYWESRNVPFYKPKSYIKSIWSLVSKEESIFDKLKFLYDEHKNLPYIGITILNKPILLVISPELIKNIFIKDFEYFMNRNTNIKESVDPITYNSLFFANNDLWRSLRSKLSPTYSSRKMKYMFPLKKSCANNLLKYFQQRDGSVLEIKEVMRRFTVDVISSCAFGIDSLALFDEDSEIFKVSRKLIDVNSIKRSLSICSYFIFPEIANFFKMKCGDEKAMNYFVKLFIENRRKRKEMKISRPDLIDALSNLNEDDDFVLDDVKMAAQALLFFIAGSDTTSMTLSFLLYEMAMNPKIQERLRKEVCKVFKHHHDDFTYESLQDMKYLDMVLKETLRKYPSAAFIVRETTRKYRFEETGVVLDAKTAVVISNIGIFSDPEFFPNPEKFDPYRFNEGNTDNLNSVFLPFGDGPRHCIGKRFATIVIKLSIAMLLENFQFEKTLSTQNPLKINPGAVVLESLGGIYLKVSKLKTCWD